MALEQWRAQVPHRGSLAEGKHLEVQEVLKTSGPALRDSFLARPHLLILPKEPSIGYQVFKCQDFLGLSFSNTQLRKQDQSVSVISTVAGPISFLKSMKSTAFPLYHPRICCFVVVDVDVAFLPGGTWNWCSYGLHFPKN